jgi:chromosome partitioning protein
MSAAMECRTIAFANQKGGVGKTTSVVNLGAYIASAGRKVLLIDFDPQANLSSSVGADKESPGIYDVITGKVALLDAIQETPIDGMQVCASNIDLTGANVELINADRREYFLRDAISKYEGRWEYLLVDCPPSLGILTLNGLAAVEYVFIPLQCEYFALEGLSLLMQTIRTVKRGVNPGLRIGGIFFTMYDSRTRLANEVVQEVTGYFKDTVFRTVIPRNVRLSEAPSHSVPINLYDDACIGANSYRKLAEEVINRV